MTTKKQKKSQKNREKLEVLVTALDGHVLNKINKLYWQAFILYTLQRMSFVNNDTPLHMY